MLNLKSFESFVEKYAKESLKIHNRLNEGIEYESNIYGNILNISNKTCLVINDYILALEMEEKNNEVYCLYYDNSEPDYTKDLPQNFQFVDLSQNIGDIRNQISKIFDKVWKLKKDLVFDYIVNVPPQTQRGLEYKLIADVNSFIFCYPFLKLNGKKSTKDERGERVIIYRRGKSVYYSFDESNVMDEFDRLIYDCRGINFKRGRKVSSSEWSKFDNKDKSTRYLVAVFSEDEDDDTINNRNQESVDLDEEDYSWDPAVGRDDDHPFVGMSEPKIYAFSSKEVNDVLKGRSEGESIKVGDTNRTVSRRLSEWREKFPDLVRIKSWDAVLSGCGEGIDGKIFRDYTIHKLLTHEVNDEYHKEGKKISHVEIEEFPDEFIEKKRYSNEFFRNCTKDDVEHAIEILKERCKENRSKFLYDLKDNSGKGDDAILPSHDKHGGFVDRDIQAETINGFVKALKAGKKKMLMYAVMRFGKTYVACRCAQQMEKNGFQNRFTVIVTAKPGVRNEWTGTVNPNDEFTGYDMYDATDKKGGLSEMLNKWAETKEGAEPTLESYFSFDENKNKHIMLFSSLHDLFGDTKSKNKLTLKPDIKEKHKCFNKFPVDLLIIDECHYGTQTGNFGAVIGEKENPELKEFMKTLNLKNTVKLYLSGTPYDLLLDDKFYDDEIIAAKGFMDIIDAKNKWDKEHKEAIERGDEKWEDNPYFGTPEMLEFGYNLEDFKLSEYSDDYNTTFEQLFLCHKVDDKGNEVGKDKPGKWEFIHRQDIEDIFEILDGSKSKEGLVSFLDVPEIKKGNMCKHIVITLPNTNCCDALEDLLIEKRNEFNNFGEYKIIKASTANGEIDTEKVKKLIESHVKAGNKTITLTCDRLLTGVTIKPWDTMFFMKDCKSPQEYDQAKFRIMTPYVKKVKSIDIDESGNPIKGDVTKVNMKPQVLFVDFLQNRIVEMKLNRYEAEFAAEGEDDYSDRKIREKIQNEKGSITLLLLKDGKFVSGSSADVGKIVLDIREKRANDMTFDQVLNETDKLSEPTDEEIDYMLTHAIKRTSSGKAPSGTTIELRKHLDKSEFPAGEKTVDDKSEKKLTRAEKMDKLKKENPDKYKQIVKICKEGRKTIVKDVLMYLLLKNRGTRAKSGDTEEDNYSTINEFGDLIDSFNHYTGFDRPKVKTTKAEDIPSQMKENDKIICSVFCDDLGIEEPNYDDPHKVSETVEEILDMIQTWWNIIKRNKHDKHIVLQSWSNMQMKYSKFEKSGKDDFESLRDVLSKYSRLGETEIVTPKEICPELFKDVVIFSKKDRPLILDCYCGKIGEVFNEMWNSDKFKNIPKKDRLNSYYLICKNRTIAELNFFTIKSQMKGDDGVKGYGTHELKRKWFNEHILIYDPTKEVKPSILTEQFETFSEFMKMLNKGKYINEKKVKSELKIWEEEGGLLGLRKAIENKWPGMKFDICVGNPPYGADKKGSSRFLHYMILKTALTFCSDKLTFIMPSKPIVAQLEDKWFNVFKNAVCTHIEVVSKAAFPNTTMDKTAIYYCDINASPNDYDKQLDVDKKIYNAIDAEGHRLFIDGMKKMESLKISIPVGSKTKEGDLENVKKKTKDDKWYLNVSRANGAFGAQWFSGVLVKEDVKTRDEEIKFCEVHDKTKNIIECPTKEYGENLKSLMINGLVLRYSLWLTQTNQAMKKPVFRYVPNVNYGEIHNDSELLSACGFSEDEIKTVLDYLKDFKFDENRNDIVRDYEKREGMHVTDFESENDDEEPDVSEETPIERRLKAMKKVNRKKYDDLFNRWGMSKREDGYKGTFEEFAEEQLNNDEEDEA